MVVTEVVGARGRHGRETTSVHHLQHNPWASVTPDVMLCRAKQGGLQRRLLFLLFRLND